ncbi:MAG: L-2-amino-thiazoline-4-carboxylic acid hydrolase [Flavisolibacter sp.]
MSEENTNQPEGIGSHQSIRPISTLERREIQAPILARVIAAFTGELGSEEAMQAASAAIQADAREAAKAMVRRYGGNGVQELLQVVTEVWAEDDALVYDLLEQTDQKLSFDVTRCRYAEMYARLGLKEYGCCLSCNRDEAFISEFNPRMKLVRTSTIMQGAQCCDFRIIVAGN